MFIKSYRIPARRLLMVGVLFVAAVALLVYGIGARISKPVGQVDQEASAKVDKRAAKGVAKSEEDRQAFIMRFGWEAGQEPEEVAEIVIPEEFDEVYTRYNELQKKQSFDLEKYRGERCKRYTYTVTNYPDQPEHVRINILVLDGKVIGGDVCSTELNGFMHGFAKDSTVTTALELPLPPVKETATVVGDIDAPPPEEEAAETDLSAEPPVEDTLTEELAAMMAELSSAAEDTK